MNKLFDKFKLNKEKEEYQTVITTIDSGVVFRGTKLWVLIFAIFVASLGLNVNSTAVIIGAMLISPLMGPIRGIGLGMGINDISLFRKALYNYLVATGAALITSTVFFLISPLSDAHSEILARTAPNIYDVLIALFGGLAGILATSSKEKGNVIPGVAIATALMPPLCTAGYGLATFQFNFFFGAFYLFIINTVFIALATFIMVRLLRFPEKKFQSEQLTMRAHRIVWVIVLLTLLPSIYFGYDIVQQERFSNNASRFIRYEAHFPNDYLLSKNIDAKSKQITLVFGGKEITASEIKALKNKLQQYDLKDNSLEIKQGFAYLTENNDTKHDEEYTLLSNALDEKEKQEKMMQVKDIFPEILSNPKKVIRVL
ncbi:MAG: TIGR00341 family protein [Bacteroidota bacterium]|nr:TIGR00341 family protein [Bacteroidota bacterium]